MQQCLQAQVSFEDQPSDTWVEEKCGEGVIEGVR